MTEPLPTHLLPAATQCSFCGIVISTANVGCCVPHWYTGRCYWCDEKIGPAFDDEDDEWPVPNPQ